MLDKSVMFSILKGTALVASLLFMQRAGAKMDLLLILALAFSCIFLAEYILGKIKLPYSGTMILMMNIVMILGIFLWDEKSMFPLLVVVISSVLDDRAKGEYFYYLSLSSILLVAILMVPNGEILCVGVIFLSLLYYIRLVRHKADSFRNLVLEQKEEIAILGQKLQDNKRLVKTLQYTAALEERNRLAARLHDKVGHGISGSIILLEASRLMADKDMEKAKEGIDKVLHNLREGVDDIRMALREERPVRSELGINEIQTALEKFQVTHNISAKLEQSGNLDYIGIEIWQCIYDNLEEVLTNLLKHSNANQFKLSIQILPKIIRVEYGDNGKTEGKFLKGLGLEAIEERTIKCGGRCYFDKTEDQFRVTNIFTY